MSNPTHDQSRRRFLETLGGASALLLADASMLHAAPTALPAPEWNLSWADRVRRAKHRALFDAPGKAVVLDLATRYLDNVQTVYGNVPEGDVVAVLNIRTTATSLGLSDAMWQKYPIGEDTKTTDPSTNAPAKRNLDWRPTPPPGAIVGNPGIEKLQQRGAIVIVCDFALGHLSGRLAKAVGATTEAVHDELRANLVPGGFLVPSGIFGAAQAQNAGCAFVPA
jgi:hypothetical protein